MLSEKKSKKILVLNCRIHSVDFEVFEMPQEKELCRGIVDKIGLQSAVVDYQNHHFVQSILDHQSAIENIIKTITDKDIGVLKSIDEIDGIGHRVIHGGEKYFSSVIITEEVKKEIYRNFELAPLHNPYNFKGIEAVEKLLPKKPQVAVFDTSFHQTIPEVAYRYPLPERIFQQYRIRKYGFHGISHKYVAERTAYLLKKPIGKVNLISMHFGQGSSLCAIKNGKSIDTTMGFTPLEGIMMTTRTGSIDPGIVFFLLKSGWSLNDLESCFNRESGVFGISGISDDMKEVVNAMQKSDKKAKLAIDMFVYRIREFLGAYYILLGKVDAISFTGGIGENSDIIRKKILGDLEFIGIKIDDRKNKKANGVEAEINSSDSKIKVFVIPRNEKIEIAREVYRLIK
ncbi:MAG: acetate/propionate family kinase [Endomicrobiia bacterium]